MGPHHAAGKSRRKIKIQKPAIQSPEEERLWRDVHKYASLIPSEAEPNLGRVLEIKEEIQEGNYPTSRMIEETAARLAIRFMKRD